MKRKLRDLAVFGGPPTFPNSKPVGQLYSPPIKKVLSSVFCAYQSRRLTNDGPLVQKLEKKLADFHRVSDAVAVTNAGTGISLVLRAIAKGRKGEVILPGFSFRGLSHFVVWAGLKPRFVDVDEKSHSLNIAKTKEAINSRTIAILAVSKCHSFGNRDELCEIAKSLGVPLVFDSVYAMGATYRGEPAGRGGIAEVFSLHATKLINGFEGGYITTCDLNLSTYLRRARNFYLGDDNSKDLAIFGTNAKLNEIHAAMALASLTHVKKLIAKNKKRFLYYSSKLAPFRGINLLVSPQPKLESMSHVLNILEVSPQSPFTRDQLVTLLRPEGTNVTPYYSPPLSRAPMNPKCVKKSRLPVCEKLAQKFIQLPSGNYMRENDIDRLAMLLCFLWTNAREINLMLKKYYD